MEKKRRTEESSETYFKPVPMRHSFAIKLFASLFGISLLAVIITSFFLDRAYLTVLNEHVSQPNVDNLKSPLKDQLFIILLFVVIPSLVIAYLLSSYVGRPIQEILFAIRQIARGNLTVRIRTKRRGELGNLILLFNHMTEQLKNIQTKNEDIAKLKSTFVTVIAHQLRTPATSTRWGLQSLLKSEVGKLSEKQERTVRNSYEANERLLRILNDVLNASEIEEGKFYYSFEEVRVKDLLKETIAAFGLGTEKNQTRIVFIDKAEKNLRAILDPTRIRVVLDNLLMNAVQYSRAGEIIECMLKNDQNTLTIEVKDSGIGIPEKDRDQIFNRFYRASNALKIHPNGSGVGLYVNKHIVEHHGGKIWFTSEEGVGSTFFVTLPLRREHLTHEAPIERFMEAI